MSSFHWMGGTRTGKVRKGDTSAGKIEERQRKFFSSRALSRGAAPQNRFSGLGKTLNQPKVETCVHRAPKVASEINPPSVDEFGQDSAWAQEWIENESPISVDQVPMPAMQSPREKRTSSLLRRDSFFYDKVRHIRGVRADESRHERVHAYSFQQCDVAQRGLKDAARRQTQATSQGSVSPLTVEKVSKRSARSQHKEASDSLLPRNQPLLPRGPSTFSMFNVLPTQAELLKDEHVIPSSSSSRALELPQRLSGQDSFMFGVPARKDSPYGSPGPFAYHVEAGKRHSPPLASTGSKQGTVVKKFRTACPSETAPVHQPAFGTGFRLRTDGSKQTPRCMHCLFEAPPTHEKETQTDEHPGSTVEICAPEAGQHDPKAASALTFLLHGQKKDGGALLGLPRTSGLAALPSLLGAPELKLPPISVASFAAQIPLTSACLSSSKGGKASAEFTISSLLRGADSYPSTPIRNTPAHAENPLQETPVADLPTRHNESTPGH